MRTLWRDSWIEVPSPHRVPGATLIDVVATVPVVPLGAAHGRRFDNPLRKVASFLLTDGPSATWRKVRAKRAESAYTGDYHLVCVLGRRTGDAAEGTEGTGGADGTQRVVALAPRAPRCADRMLVADPLVRPAPPDFDAAALGALAAAMRGRLSGATTSLSQTYLYSTMAPPADLVDTLDGALNEIARRPLAGGAEPVIRPPGGAGEGAELLHLGRGLHTGSSAPARPPLAILGAGDYVRIELAPALADAPLERAVLADREPQIAALAAIELGFAAATTDARAAIDELDRRGIVIVATAHDSHAELAAHALRCGHRVICEKPAVVTGADLDLLLTSAAEHPGELEVGFNRRHNPIVERARLELQRASGPTTLVATIREVDITPEHWYLWPNQGTRVAGNLCHWIDLAVHLLGPGPEVSGLSVSPRVSDEPGGLDAERAFTFSFDDGSTVVLVPTGRGDSVRGVQEGIEARRGAVTVRIDDLWRLSGLRAGRPLRHRTAWRDKGHARMYADALARFSYGRPAAYPIDDLRRVGEAQLAATALLGSGRSSGTAAELLEPARR